MNAAREQLVLELRQPTLFRDTIQERFVAFHHANPQVFRRLADHAFRLKRRGYERAGIGMLFEVLRWEHMLNAKDPSSEYQLNNNYRSRYARLLMDTYPELRGFFEVRDLRSN